MFGEKQITKKIALIIVMIIFETILLKKFLYDIFPPKYFFDSNKILSIMDGTRLGDDSYLVIANFFKTINIFNFSTLMQWGAALATLTTPILVYIISKKDDYNIFQMIFIMASIGLLNIYIICLSKEYLQFIYFFIIYLILISNLKNDIKVPFIVLIFLFEAFTFRIYYGIIAMLVCIIYCIYNIFLKTKNEKKCSPIIVILLILTFFFLGTFLISIVTPENYNSIVNARYDVNIVRENDVDGVTKIMDPLGKNTNFLKFILNYIINAFRMLFPLELIFKGKKYIIFTIYQIYITYILILNIKNINSKNLLWIITAVSFIMVSIIFEPDFGSFIKHESATFLILLELTNFLNIKLNKQEKALGGE